MLFTTVLLAAISQLAVCLPTPVVDITDTAAAGKFSGRYYKGGSLEFPPKSAWVDFNMIFNQNKGVMQRHGDTGSDIEHIRTVVQSISSSFGVDARVLLCMIMEESNGDVGTQAGDGGRSKGLMQAMESPSYAGRHGLSQGEISGMIKAGTHHFKKNLQTQGNDDSASTYYKALRAYNSGDHGVNYNNLSDGGVGTASYVSDVANCLQGHSMI